MVAAAVFWQLSSNQWHAGLVGTMAWQCGQIQAGWTLHDGHWCCRELVRVSVTDVDRARTDDPTLTCVVVEANAKGRAKVYTVACKAGVLKERYHAAYLDHVPMMTPLAVGLATVLAGWHGLPKDIALRAATRSQSMVGGQGMLHCACQGKCDTKKCKCKKAGRECSSRCHKSNTQCTNCDK